jgi:hypothetical protein
LLHDIGGIFADTGRRYRSIERVGLAPAIFNDLIELAAEGVLRGSIGQS